MNVIVKLSVLFLMLWPEAADAVPDKRSLILVLLDGCRWDCVDPEITPNLYKLAKSGIRGEMIPVWPPISSPNHWALVTGLNSKHGGPFHNEMYDPATGQLFKFTQAGLPMASLFGQRLKRQGGISGVIGFWAGVDMPEESKRPSYYVPYGVTAEDGGFDWNVKLALQLLNQPTKMRPRLLTLYGIEIDVAQHVHGVRSVQAVNARKKLDRIFGDLVSGLSERHMDDRVDVVVVADHGSLDAPEVVYFDQLADGDKLMNAPVGGGPIVSLWPKPGMEQAVYDQVRTRFPHLHPFRPNEIPSRLECCEPSRVPPILVTADPGWQMVARGQKMTAHHGYDNEIRDMHAIFIAKGPSFKSGIQLPPFHTVDVYSMLAAILQIRPKNSDGSIIPLCAALREPRSPAQNEGAAFRDAGGNDLTPKVGPAFSIRIRP